MHNHIARNAECTEPAGSIPMRAPRDIVAPRQFRIVDCRYKRACQQRTGAGKARLSMTNTSESGREETFSRKAASSAIGGRAEFKLASEPSSAGAEAEIARPVLHLGFGSGAACPANAQRSSPNLRPQSVRMKMASCPYQSPYLAARTNGVRFKDCHWTADYGEPRLRGATKMARHTA
jgi:hypothetical protein